MHQKIPTFLGTIILIICAFTAATFVWLFEKNCTWPDPTHSSVRIKKPLEKQTLKPTPPAAESKKDEGLKICPDEWISNQMPRIIDQNNRPARDAEYFILDGKRREINEFDSAWVRQNCNLKKQIVQ